MWRHVSFFVLVSAVLAAAWLVPLPARLSLTDSRVVRYADGRMAYVTLSPDEQWRLPEQSSTVDAQYVEALLAFEDARFYYHFGVDPFAMVRAAVLWAIRGHAVSGGSTITMQLVRMIEPRPRTVRSKLIECVRALQLELRLSKDEILAHYLRLAPFGRNLEGVRAASIAYFGHAASELAPHEIAMLVTVPQDPNKRYPTAVNHERTQDRVWRVTERLRQAGVFDEQAAHLARTASLPLALRPFPREAPHAAVWLLHQQPDAQVLDTTLQQGVQRIAERVMASYRTEWQAVGIDNGAVVVLDTKTREVLAAVGNFSFDDAKNAGQVVGFAAPRAPGSLLKPFVYALSIDHGLLLPSYQLLDVPRRFGTYEPKNFDERFRGLVRADQALSQSLNLPFVDLLAQLQPATLLQLLERGGLSTLRPASTYGLSLAIGGAEVTLLDITTLYAALARDGAYAPFTFAARTVTEESQLLSPGASYLTRQALSLRDRPDFPSRRGKTKTAPHFFWKTGTSFHFRDAWAVGGNDKHTIGVWTGNFDGHGVHALVGAERAAPLLFDLFDGVEARGPALLESAAPADLAEVDVCGDSGLLASGACPHHTHTLARSASVPTERCAMHRQVEVDVATGHAVCPLCRAGKHTELRTVTVIPTSVTRLRGEAATTLPTHTPSCPHALAQRTAKIRAPEAGATLLLVHGLDPSQQQIALEVDAPDDQPLFWFVNGKLLGPAKPRERQWLTPELGRLDVRVVDADGRGDRVVVYVDELG